MPIIFLTGLELNKQGEPPAFPAEVNELEFFCVRNSLAGSFLPRGAKFVAAAEKLSAGVHLRQLKDSLVESVLQEAHLRGRAAYACFGHPMEDAAARALYKRALSGGMEVKIFPARSFFEAALEMLPGQCQQGLALLDALDLDSFKGPSRMDIIVTDIYSPAVYGSWLKKVSSFYGQSHRVELLYMSGEKAGSIARGTASSPPPFSPDSAAAFRILPAASYLLEDLAQLMARLRGPRGCPWDRLQDHISLRPYLLEEAFEVIEAINKKDMESLKEELGDLLLQIIFHSCLAEESGSFSLWQVIDAIAAKIVRRHPHVFGDLTLKSAGEVMATWQKIKSREKGHRGRGRFDFPAEFPALLRCQKVQKRAADVGFDWPDISGALEKLEEEIAELKDVYNSEDREKIEEELGDLLFAVVNVARFLKIDSETALNGAIEKFVGRFSYIEEQVKARGGDFSKFCLKDLDFWWNEAKNSEKTGKK